MSSSELEDNSVAEAEEVSDEEEVARPVKKRASKKKKKDPNAPKRPQSAFFLFSNAMRSVVKEESPNATFGEVAKLLSEKFKALTASEKSKWEKKAQKDKDRYHREMEHYVPPSDDEEEIGRKKKKKKDPNAPKRNMSAFFIYSNEVRDQVKTDNPGIKFGDVAKMISAQFKALSPDERKKFDDYAAKDKERYLREKAAYDAGQ
mmetsp:Transcript_32819/g.47512  ORF Transcript_32819/g.47512 Transcript_32819/m.47512 type:complete len:204 (-) Transcript_32819:310-921(-)|eukprot:CAMPEP_0116024484 /NCGR_PEP_ID=MMETSP0321-20121206/12344_1 /TAXON_ID=163516 /ORGANISM="Leptocylindrus danicus var. danicus, Strain B650" /LENGTH=203 /DNA_ID=CAMNT_0003496223 /DNA_START=182 /DNA_END=793 /DNA_ORIENTATION=+